MLLATVCEPCRHVGLQDFGPNGADGATCARCGAAVSVVPSCSYNAADIELFDELRDLVAQGNVTAREALQLAKAAVNALESRSFAHFYDGLSQRLPGLSPVQLLFLRKPGLQQRATAMLRTIFDGLAITSKSGARPAVSSTPGSDDAKGANRGG
jgi:hypothetical protein